MPDHNIPTLRQEEPIQDPVSKKQVDTLAQNASEFGLPYYGLLHPLNGIIHVVGPETGLTQPGMTIVCGDSQTSTHGAMGAIAFGIGTSEVEMVLATQCLLQQKPKTMRITIDGTLNPCVTAKDVALYLISRMTTGGATGYFVEYAGEVIRRASMEERLTICNLTIEMGARGGMIAPDETTFDYLKDKEFAPKGLEWEKAVNYWRTLHTDEGAVFDREISFRAEDIEPMITYGTNPGMGMGITEAPPTPPEVGEQPSTFKSSSFSFPLWGKSLKGEGGSGDGGGLLSFQKSLDYMGFQSGEKLLGKPIDYVFLGSCTNGRIEDFRAFAGFVKGKKKHPRVVAWLVPGSWHVEKQIRAEGLDKILEEAGFELRQPGCSACLAMNEDKVPAGKYCVSTSNRNFEGRQGPGARTLLAGTLVAAAAAITGRITDPRGERK
jgi:3-isopropylmalate/(R)-2-methylmalate dehydratase large subunit